MFVDWIDCVFGWERAGYITLRVLFCLFLYFMFVSENAAPILQSTCFCSYWCVPTGRMWTRKCENCFPWFSDRASITVRPTHTHTHTHIEHLSGVSIIYVVLLSASVLNIEKNMFRNLRGVDGYVASCSRNESRNRRTIGWPGFFLSHFVLLILCVLSS